MDLLPEADVYLSRIQNDDMLRVLVDEMNEHNVSATANWNKNKPLTFLDPESPVSWPRQKVLSQLVHDVRRDELLEAMSNQTGNESNCFKRRRS